jgi:hypothetical protein
MFGLGDSGIVIQARVGKDKDKDKGSSTKDHTLFLGKHISRYRHYCQPCEHIPVHLPVSITP